MEQSREVSGARGGSVAEVPEPSGGVTAAPDIPEPRLKRSNSLALKNYPKWRQVERHASRPLSRFLPTKLFYDQAKPEDRHTVEGLKSAFPTVGLILDLQNQQEAYSVTGTGVLRWRVPHESKKLPSRDTIRAFSASVARFLDQDAGNGAKLIGVHCHYGFNRTGFVIISHLVEVEGWNVDKAIAEFATVRPPGIKHAHFLDELRRRYAAPVETPVAKLVPSWWRWWQEPGAAVRCSCCVGVVAAGALWMCSNGGQWSAAVETWLWPFVAPALPQGSRGV